ncbi:AAA family ATPase [Crocosphaera sp. XPORK-15E]|uniref:AAA family ATPase n=1 Tax=Crocosphaera sp. XPORK-15E TaxID=3110247 RepID=UPI002B219A90|nr:AAA family ATPase [Crocosphaera sp. XPORK-15E]MEA5534396.1 AAA family ATPase [Crocosphaera sp. XPORK-15E]
MYIKKIEFTNFRGFQELSLELPKDLAVFIGVNGSGKTSILDGVYKFIFAFIYGVICDFKNTIDYRQFPGTGINSNDINDSQKESIISVLINSILYKNNNLDNLWKLTSYRGLSKAENTSLIKYNKELSERIRKESNYPIPILVYYQTSALRIYKIGDYKKMFQIFAEKSLHLHSDQFAAYNNTLIKELNDYQNFLQWFSEQENYENEVRLRENFEYRSKKLEIIRNALEIFLTYLSKTNFSDLRIVRTKSDKSSFNSISIKPELTISKNGIDLTISQLSEGEKKCILIVADIARRLAIANPGLEVNEVLKQGNGMILIDEIEAHLHPQWQREIIPALTKTFPSCQFIVTTHSPQVLSKVKRENVFILEDGNVISAKDEDYYTYGRDSNSILSEIMEVPERPLEIKQQIRDCLDLIDEGFKLKDDIKLREAKAKINELSDLLGEDDLDIVSLNTTFKLRSRVK